VARSAQNGAHTPARRQRRKDHLGVQLRGPDPAAKTEASQRWAGMLPTVLGNLKTLIEQP
jgi:hypothetical protein